MQNKSNLLGRMRTSIIALCLLVGMSAQAQDTLAVWDATGFSNGTPPPFYPTASNATNAIMQLTSNSHGTKFCYNYYGGAEGTSYMAQNWTNGADTLAWHVQLVTTGHTSIKISSKQRSRTNISPKEFKLQYSLNNTTWVDVYSPIDALYTAWTGTISNVALPAACDNQAVVYLRWVMRSNIDVGGGTNPYDWALIDDIVITGTAGPSNAAPIIDSTSITLAAGTEDAATTAQTISTILTGKASDTDGDALGIAVYGVSGDGQWQQSTDGVSWFGFDYNSPAAAPLSSTNAKLLAPNMHIRFVPNADWNGTAQFQYRAWDQTTGTNLAFVDVTTNGAATAYSATTGTVTQVINAVNDAPEVILPNTAGVLNFGGGTEYVDVPDFATTANTFTVEAWIYVDNVNKNWARIIDFGNGSANNNMEFGFNGTTGRMFIETFNGGSSLGNTTTRTPSALPANQWVHVAAVWHGNNTATIYWNGVAQVTGPQNSIAAVTRTSNYIGKSNWADEYFDGKMTDVRIWNTARSQSEIASNMSAQLQGNEAGLLMYYKASEVGSTYLADYSANNKWGTMVGTNWLTVQAPVASVSTPKNTARTISGIQLSDVDAASYDVTVTFSVANGTLSTTAPGVVTGNGTATLTVTNNLADLNAAFNAGSLLTYTPNNNFTGTDELTVNLNDAGAYGSGGALMDEESIIINVIPAQNAAPVMGNQTFSVNENSANGTIVDTIVATDADGNPLIFSMLSQSLAGAYAVDANGQITVADASLLDYETVTSSTISVQVSDGSATATATITVNINNQSEATAPFAATFNGTSSEVNLGNPSHLNWGAADYSVSCWFRSTAGGVHVLTGKQVDGGTLRGWYLRLTWGRIEFAAGNYDASWNSNGSVTSTQQYNDGKWHHATGVLDGANGLVKLYVDGVLVNQATGSNTYNIDNTAPLMIGRKANGERLPGDIDEVAIFNRALTAAEVAEIKHSKLTTTSALYPNLIYHNQMDEGAGSMVFDMSTNGLNATLANGSWVALAPALPTIIGTDSVLSGASQTYTASYGNANSRMYQHTWAVTGGTITGYNADSTQATVLWGNSSTSGSVSYTAAHSNWGTTESATDLGVTITLPLTMSAQSFSLAENEPTNTVVGTMTANGNGNPYNFALLSQSHAGTFSVMPNGEVLVANNAALDYEQYTSLTLTVAVSDGYFTDTATITVNITDVNEAPSMSAQSFSVAENSAAGTAIGVVTASDEDGDTLAHSIVGQSVAGAFAISPSGQITIDDATAINFEANSIITLTVRASDGSLYADATITVNVTDVNETPVIAAQSFAVGENYPNGTLVGTVFSTDPDGTTATYTLLSQSAPGAFVLNSSGQISIADAALIDHETYPTITLTVRAADTALYADGIMTVTITDVNEAPVMADAQIATDEDVNIRIGGAIDAANPNTYTDVDGDNPRDVRFTVLPTQGILQIGNHAVVLGQVYDMYDYMDAYYIPDSDFNGTDSFSVEANDGQLWPANAANITITVNAVNDAPVVEDFAVATDEDQSVTIAQFANSTTFSDIENDMLVQFEVVQVPANGVLTLYGDTLNDGDLVADADLDFVTYVPNADFNGSDSFVWNATDGVDFAANTAVVNITVLSVNDAPVAIAASAASVDENTAVNTMVATLSTTDIDAGDSHYYQLVNGAGSLGNIYFYISGNQLLVANNINYELTGQLSIRVSATDQSGEYYEEVILLSINDKNDAPSALTLSNTVIDEQQAAGNFVGILMTADEDANDSHTWTLTSGNGDADNASFSIVNNVLVNNTVLDFNTQQQYFIRVSTTDAAGAAIEEEFVINLTDVNQAPTAIAISHTAIAENNLVGDFIGHFTATDVDANDTHTYSLVSGAGDADNISFSIDGNNLRAHDVFDFETKASYTIRVRATDAGGAHTEEQFTITIIDATDAPVGITMSSTSIDENKQSGSLVGSFSTIDPDQTGGHIYSLVGGNGSDDNGSFYISGSALFSSMQFNYEVKHSYTVRVRSVDNAGGYTEEVFTIAINDMNDRPADVTVTVIGIDENTPIGTTAGFITAIDEDISDSHTFTLAPGFGGTDNVRFTIDANKLQVNALLDFEQQNSYAVRLRATDNGGEFVEKYFVITISDVNEVPTALTLSGITIAENEPAGSIIGTFSTADQDNADSHVYSFATGSGDDDNSAFHISGNMLVANASFNFEIKDSYTIRVSSTDMGGLKLEEVFVITVTDKADAPVIAGITKSVYKNKVMNMVAREFTHVYSQEEGRALKSIKITSLPTQGELLFGNAPVAVGDMFLLAELNDLSYNPMYGYLGADAFTFAAFDGVSHSTVATYSISVVPNRQIGTAVTTLTSVHLINLRPIGNVNREEAPVSVGVEEMPLELSAFGNYPNPFQGATNITFELPTSMEVTLEVFDMLGRKVETLVNGEQLSGQQSIVWNGNEAGNYICRIVATGTNGQVITKTISLLQVK